MVQYVFTPWRNRRELLAVRGQFYPEHSHPRPISSTYRYHGGSGSTASEAGNGEEGEREKQKAVARVSMWMHRGGCPHLVESTALLTAAMLSDDGVVAPGVEGQGRRDGANGTGSARASKGYAVRAAYSAAFSRLVFFFFSSSFGPSHPYPTLPLSLSASPPRIGTDEITCPRMPELAS